MNLLDINISENYIVNHAFEIGFYPTYSCVDCTGFAVWGFYNEIFCTDKASDKEYLNKISGCYKLEEDGRFIHQDYKTDFPTVLPEEFAKFVYDSPLYKLGKLNYVEIYPFTSKHSPTGVWYSVPLTQEALDKYSTNEKLTKLGCVAETTNDLAALIEVRSNYLESKFLNLCKDNDAIRQCNGRVKWMSDPRFKYVETAKEKQGTFSMKIAANGELRMLSGDCILGY